LLKELHNEIANVVQVNPVVKLDVFSVNIDEIERYVADMFVINRKNSGHQ